MTNVRFAAMPSRSTAFLACTSLTLNEFPPLIPSFEAACYAPLVAGRLAGQPWTARRLRVDQHCPLPTPEDRLCFLLTSLKTYSLQGVQGRLFGRGQSQVHQGIYVLLPALLAALRTLGDAPGRSLTALA